MAATATAVAGKSEVGHPDPLGVKRAAGQLPSVTVIVPTFNRAGLLRKSLQSLAAQDYPADRIEIVVVDNASSDNTQQVVTEIMARSALPIRYFRKDNRGPAVSRNFALSRSSSQIVGFTDSDCLMRPDWVRQAVRCMEEEVGLVAGPVRPAVDRSQRPGFFSHQVDHSRENAVYPTANIFYRREILDEVGHFDETFGAYPWGPPVGGEDIDLAWRVKRAGYRAVFVEQAAVYHEASKVSILAWLVDPVKKQVIPRMVARYPELRKHLLWARLFIDPSTAAFDLAIVGLAGAGLARRRALLSLALPWLLMMRGWIQPDIWPPSRWWRIPIKYALLVEQHGLMAAVLAIASIRYRAPVL